MEVKDWNEEVVKWLAVAMVLTMIGTIVMPCGVGNVGATLAGLYAGSTSNNWQNAVVSGAFYGWGVGTASSGIYLGLIALGVATGPAFAAALGIAL